MYSAHHHRLGPRGPHRRHLRGPRQPQAALYRGRGQGRRRRRPAHDHHRRRELPGLPGGDHGPELMELFKQQAERFGTEFVSADVERSTSRSHPFKRLDRRAAVRGRDASSSPRARARAGSALPNEQQLQNRGVSACATCDGYFFRNQDVAVVGGGDTAMEEALYLAGLCKSVTVIHRRDELRASKIMARARARAPEDQASCGTRVVDEVNDVEGGEVTGVVLEDTVKTATASRRWRSRACSSPSATRRTPSIFKGQLDARRERLHRDQARHHAAPTSRACSPPATCRTTSTARPSRPPAPAAWPRSKPSAGWPRASRAH